MLHRFASQLFRFTAAGVALLACSTFSESDPMPTTPEEAGADGAVPEGGLDGATAEDGGDASTDCPTCVVVASTGTSTIVDVRVVGANVLWATTSGVPWSMAQGNVFYAPQTGSQAPTNKVFPTDVTLGSLAGSATAGQAFVSLASVSGPSIQALVDNSGSLTAKAIPLTVGPLTIRLVESKGTLYWLSRDESATSLQRWSQAGPSGFLNFGPEDLFDLAISEADATSPLAFVAGAAGISMKVVNGSDGFGNPVVNSPNVTSLATSTDGLYWGTSDGLLQFCPVSPVFATMPNCVPSTVLTVTNDAIADVIVSGSDFFAATASGSIYRCPRVGCPEGAKPLVSHAPLFDQSEYLNGHTLAATPTALFWSEGGAQQTHRIVRLPL